MEIWKDIPGYENKYQVSNLGKVKSLKRIVKYNDGRTGFFKEKTLKPFIAGDGYFKVSLRKEKRTKTFSVHQLVAMGFLDHTLCGMNKVVDHKDYNCLNNNLENLQIITNRLNLSKDKKNGSSRYTGVCWSKAFKKWQSNIVINGKKKHLGYFKNEYDAHLAYKYKLKEIESEK